MRHLHWLFPLILFSLLGVALWQGPTRLGAESAAAPYGAGRPQAPRATAAPHAADRAHAQSSNGATAPADQPPTENAPFGNLSEGFDNITTLPGMGWALLNRSEPVGTLSWFQGNDAVFPAQAGAPTAYIGANFNSTTGTGTISNWLLTPVLNLQNGDTFTFWTRTTTGSTFPDRLQVRLSTAGASTDVGTTSTSVGVFGTLLLDINPTYTVGGYPAEWTQFTLPLSGLGGATQGRLAFRYFVENGGPNGTNSDYIGIDTVSYSSPLGTCSLGGTPQNTTWNFTNGAQGWTEAISTTGTISDPWTLTTTNPPTSTTNSPSGGNRFFAPDFEGAGAGYFHEAYLISPAFEVPGGIPATLTFWNYQQFELADTQCWDSGLLEVSTNSGSTWSQIQNPNLPGNPYDLTIHDEYLGQTRLGGAPAWCPSTPPPVGDGTTGATAPNIQLTAPATSTPPPSGGGTTGFRDWDQYNVDLSGLVGQTIKLRFTFFVDNNTAGYGWQIDDVQTQTCPPSGGPTPTHTNTPVGPTNTFTPTPITPTANATVSHTAVPPSITPTPVTPTTGPTTIPSFTPTPVTPTIQPTTIPSFTPTPITPTIGPTTIPTFTPTLPGVPSSITPTPTRRPAGVPILYLPLVIRAAPPPAPTCEAVDREPNNLTAQAVQNLPLCRNSVVNGTMPLEDNSDYYRIIVTTAGNFTVRLTDISEGANYQLLLINTQAQTVGISQTAGNADEIITVPLTPGTYYIYVSGVIHGGANTYQLIWQ